MKKTIGPYLSRIETTYTLRAKLTRANKRIEELEQQLQQASRSPRPKPAPQPKPDARPAAAAKPLTLPEAKSALRNRLRAEKKGAAFAVPRPELERERYELLLRHAKRGDVEAQYLTGMCSLRGWGTMRFNAGAVQWLRRAAEQGHSIAGYHLGKCLFDGTGVAKDETEGRRWLEFAADAGVEDAVRWVRENPRPSKMKFGGKPVPPGKKGVI